MGLINRQVEFEPGETAKAEEVNAEFNVIHDLVNGNIENINIADSSVDLTQKGQQNSVQSSVIAENAVTTREIDDSVTDSISSNARLETTGLKVETRTTDVNPSASNAGRIWLRTDI